MAPSTSFPGNAGFYLILILFASAFLFMAGSRAIIIARGRWENRLGSPRDILERLITFPSYVLATSRVNRSEYWYAGLLHTMIFWGFITLQIRTLNFLLDGFHEAISFQSIFGILYTLYLPVMEVFNLVFILGVGLAAAQRLFVKPARLSLNWDAWFILSLTWFLMVTDVFTNSFAIFLERGDKDAFSFLAFGVANLWDAVGMSEGVAVGHRDDLIGGPQVNGYGEADVGFEGRFDFAGEVLSIRVEDDVAGCNERVHVVQAE